MNEHPTKFLRTVLHDAGIGGAVRTTGTKAQGRTSEVSVFPEHEERTRELLEGFAQKLGLRVEPFDDGGDDARSWRIVWPPVRGRAAEK